MLYFVVIRIVQGAVERLLLLFPFVTFSRSKRVPSFLPPTIRVYATPAYVSTSILSPSAGSSCTLTNLEMASFLMIFSFNTAVVPLGNL